MTFIEYGPEVPPEKYQADLDAQKDALLGAERARIEMQVAKTKQRPAGRPRKQRQTKES